MNDIHLLKAVSMIRISNKEKRDRQILRAATAQFAKTGFDGTRVEDIADDAGVSVGTIYLRYKNKSDLLRGVLESFENRFVDAMTDPSIEQAPYPERFAEMFMAIIRTAGESTDMPAIMQLAYFAEIEGWSPGDAVRTAIKQIVEDAQANGDLRDDVPAAHVAAATHGMLEGVMRHMMATQDPNPVPYIETLTDAAARWLMAER